MPMPPDRASDHSAETPLNRLPQRPADRLTVEAPRDSLAELAVDLPAKIIKISSREPVLEGALRDIGFFEEDEVEILHQGLFGRGPLCVRLNQSLVALRMKEAQAILVQPLAQLADQSVGQPIPQGGKS